VKPEGPAGGAHTFPPSSGQNESSTARVPTAQAVLAAKNVQRGLAAKVQEMSALLRKKQKVYMDSEQQIYSGPSSLGRGVFIIHLTHNCPPELQGHAIKNQDLLIASGAISLKGSDGMSAVEEDVEAVSVPCGPIRYLRMGCSFATSLGRGSSQYNNSNHPMSTCKLGHESWTKSPNRSIASPTYLKIYPHSSLSKGLSSIA
jgi:hypothetical protein